MSVFVYRSSQKNLRCAILQYILQYAISNVHGCQKNHFIVYGDKVLQCFFMCYSYRWCITAVNNTNANIRPTKRKIPTMHNHVCLGDDWRFCPVIYTCRYVLRNDGIVFWLMMKDFNLFYSALHAVKSTVHAHLCKRYINQACFKIQLSFKWVKNWRNRVKSMKL